jgi:hypothetical protein
MCNKLSNKGVKYFVDYLPTFKYLDYIALNSQMMIMNAVVRRTWNEPVVSNGGTVPKFAWRD